ELLAMNLLSGMNGRIRNRIDDLVFILHARNENHQLALADRPLVEQLSEVSDKVGSRVHAQVAGAVFVAGVGESKNQCEDEVDHLTVLTRRKPTWPPREFTCWADFCGEELRMESAV